MQIVAPADLELALPPVFSLAAMPSDWPLRARSERIVAGNTPWHVQRTGTGPPLLMLHGTGASTHSMAALAQELADEHEIILVDLPGHGFTPPLDNMSLPAIRTRLGALLDHMNLLSLPVVGHSAGAAVGLALAMDNPRLVTQVIGINAALVPFDGVAGALFSPLARGLSRSTLVAKFLAARIRTSGTVERLMESTGSDLDATQVSRYRTLLGHPARVSSVLKMMSSWDLVPLNRALPVFIGQLHLVVARDDLTVPASQADTVARLNPQTTITTLARGGHLVHEVAPHTVATVIKETLELA